MKLIKIYELFVQEGIKSDLRSIRLINNKFKKAKQEYKRLSPSHRKFFDRENLSNPYSDTRILHGDWNSDVQCMMVGIDIEVAELLLADRISSSDKKIDLVLAHHPEGLALAGLHDVMGLQTDSLHQLGIDFAIAKELMNKRMEEVTRRIHGSNHTRSVDAARLLNIPFLCCHTPADNHVNRYWQRRMDQKKPKTLKQLVDLLLLEPEYQDAASNKAGPQILIGKPQDKAGKILVDMTGGTEGSKEIFGRLSQLGVQTYLGMHLSEDHFNKIKTEHLNVVIAGHMASDNLGMNLLLDKLEKKERINVIECSGFRRVRRS